MTAGLHHRLAGGWVGNRQTEELVVPPSESFNDGIELLKAADHMKLEGIVSKRRDAPCRSGKQSDWIKIKCQTWREANKECWRLFERR